MTFDDVAQAKAEADEAFAAAMEGLVADHIKAKEKAAKKPGDAVLTAAKRETARQLQAARMIERADRPEGHVIGGTFTGSDGNVFLPDDQGGNTARALELLAGLPDVSDPVAQLAKMRAGIS